MIRKQLIRSAAALGLLVAVPVSAAAETGSYAAVNGLRMYYQVQGTLPVSDHFAFVQRADWIAPMIKAFLDAPMPEKK